MKNKLLNSRKQNDLKYFFQKVNNNVQNMHNDFRIDEIFDSY